MKRAVVLVSLLVGCSVGQGSGAAKGPLVILDCGGPGRNFPDPMMPRDYDLHPQFFAAEQLLDLSGTQSKMNRLVIRMQNNGRRREATDILRFDMPNLYEVARCIRGRNKADGSPDYDVANCGPGPEGMRLRVGINALVRAYLTPYFSCSTKLQTYDRVGTAISSKRMPGDTNWESFIVLSALGGVLDDPLKPDFKIDIDDQIEASAFTLTIEDDAVVTAVVDPLMPLVPVSHINGHLAGSFRFAMQRGQGAQTFP
jgi:hypothetical protein